jgi:hypothetical protein
MNRATTTTDYDGDLRVDITAWEDGSVRVTERNTGKIITDMLVEDAVRALAWAPLKGVACAHGVSKQALASEEHARLQVEAERLVAEAANTKMLEELRLQAAEQEAATSMKEK